MYIIRVKDGMVGEWELNFSILSKAKIKCTWLNAWHLGFANMFPRQCLKMLILTAQNPEADEVLGIKPGKYMHTSNRWWPSIFTWALFLGNIIASKTPGPEIFTHLPNFALSSLVRRYIGKHKWTETGVRAVWQRAAVDSCCFDLALSFTGSHITSEFNMSGTQ